jgi:hypothetical protein
MSRAPRSFAAALVAALAAGAASGQDETPRVLKTSVPVGEDGPRSPRDPAPIPGERFTWLRDPLASWTHVSTPMSDLRIPEQVTGGVVLLDADQDGDLDLFLVTGGTWEDVQPGAPFPGHALFRNDGAMKFTDVAREAGVLGEDGAYGMGAAAADLDNDGDQDLYVTGLRRNWLYRNEGVRDGVPRFTECSEALGVRGTGSWSTSACFLDADGDSRLDLYVCNYCFFTVELNRRLRCGLASGGVREYCGPRDLSGLQDWFFLQQADGRFRECALEVGMKGPEPLATNCKGLGVVASDVDLDGDLDVYVANDTCPNLLFLNDGKGRFREQGMLRGCALSEDGRSQAGMGVDSADFDGDGDMDLWVTNLDLETNGLYRNDGTGHFVDDVRAAGLAAPDQGQVGFGTDFFDMDDDGDLDLAVANGHPLAHVHKTKGTLFYEQADQLFENDGKGRFRLVPASEAGAYFGVRNVARGLATGDLDGDGDLDLVVVPRDEPAVLLRNNHVETRVPAGRPPDAILLTLVGTKCNRDAVGAFVTVTAGGKRQVEEVKAGNSYVSRSDLRLHFGLGAAAQADSIQVRWPDGSVQEAGPAPAGFEYRFVQGGALETLRALKRP